RMAARTGRWAAAAAVVWMGVIFALSSLPGSAVPGRFGSLGHFVVYFVLGALYLLALRPDGFSWRAAVLAVVLASLYGISDEFHQSFVPGRTPDVADWLVDTSAAATAVIAVTLLQRRGRRA
ncbi:hypothetical protein EG835_14490, partial [bacterium]|nr:hypothetical protein [bacterium]